MPKTPADVGNLSHFNMLEQYRYGAGQFAIKFQTFTLSGSDVHQFLQAQSTFDVKSLSDHSFHIISLLDPQGRIEGYGWLLKRSEIYYLLVPDLLIDFMKERLERFLIAEDVTIDGPLAEEWRVVVGPKAGDFKTKESFSGAMFDDEAIICKSSQISEVKVISNEELEVWRGLTGWPDFQGINFKKDLINNLRLYDLSVSISKGCYPGQETVAKIATRRGAAYGPVLIEMKSPAATGILTSFDKKIGTAEALYAWEGKYYLSASLLRDFRVEGLELGFSSESQEHTGVVKYFPLLSGSRVEKAKELFYEASELFKKDDLKAAEDLLIKSIELDPTFADAYESLGVMLGRMNRYEEAIGWMQKLSEVDPKSVLAHTNMSLFLMKLGKIEEAEDQKSKATLKSFQKFGDEAKAKEQENLQKKQKESEWAQRESMFKQVLEIDEEDTLANYGLGSIAVERSDWERARNHLERVIKADPGYSVAYLALGKAYQGLGLKDEADKTWKEGITVAAKKGDLMPANQMQTEIERLKV